MKMNEWMNVEWKLMHDCKNEWTWMNELINERMCEWLHEWKNEWKNE